MASLRIRSVFILTADQIRQAEKAIEVAEGITSLQLMDRAVERMFPYVLQGYQNACEANIHSGYRAVFLCGTGNNGGDGLGLARLFHEQHPDKAVVLLVGSKPLSPNTKAQLDRLPHDLKVIHVDSPEKWANSKPAPMGFLIGFLVDALFGSGLTRPVTGLERSIIYDTKWSLPYVFSIDVPSGVSADGLFLPEKNACVQANLTLSILAQKPWEVLADQGGYGGTVIHIRLENEDVDISSDFLDPEHSDPDFFRFAMDGDWFIQSQSKFHFAPPARTRFGHKGTYGHALLMGGSLGKCGSIMLSGMASLHTGSGLTTIALPDCGTVAAQTSLPEAMCLTRLGSEFLESLPANLEVYSAIGLGPGMGRHPNSAKMLHQLLLQLKGMEKRPRLVMDADALNILSEHPDWLELLPENTILTPHPKEFDRLSNGGEPYPTSRTRVDAARAFAQKHKVIVVLKGGYTFIFSHDDPPCVVGSGAPELATGGTGDVLTGIITSLLAQGLEPNNAAVSGSYLHGIASQFATGRLGNGPRSFILTAGDVARNIGLAMQHVFGN